MMITDIYVVINSNDQRERLKEAFKEASFSLNILDIRGKEKKKAWALKSHWAAKLDPFAIVMDGDRAVKVFYSETGENIIESLINFLQL